MSKLTPLQETFGAHVGAGTKFRVISTAENIFEVGDIVTSDGRFSPNSGKTIFEGNGYKQYLDLCQVELYQPFKMGDEVEVSCNSSVWTRATFIACLKDDNRFDKNHPYVARDQKRKGGGVCAWSYCRHPKPDTSITFADGHKVELSEESYNALRGEA